MPVPSGFGKPGLDFTCCISGHFVAIEAKAPGQWLTPRQRKTAVAILRAGGKVFIISGPAGLDAFKAWVERCQPAVPAASAVTLSHPGHPLGSAILNGPTE